MLRIAILVSPLFLAACAASRTSALLVSDASAVRMNPAHAGAVDSPAEARPAESFPAPAESALATEAPPVALGFVPAEGESLHGSRFTLKGGYYGSSEDTLDDGYILNVAWTKFLNKLLAVELEIGFLDADGSDAGVDLDVWSVPIMLNGRLNVPIWILEAYGGLGIGTFYYDAEASPGDDDSGFLWGGNAFLGASINLADSIALGLEGKYYATDEISDVDTSLDAFAIMLTLGFSR